MLARVLELEIRSLEEANRRSKDEHLTRLREVPETGNCEDRNAADIADLAFDSPEWTPPRICSPSLGAVAQRGSAADGARPPSMGYLADDVDLAEATTCVVTNAS
jgi:hypothetical protein